MDTSTRISPRTRRLLSDAERMRDRFTGWPAIQISGTAGIPPEIYRVTYHVKGLYVGAEGRILERSVHTLEINLSLGYPRRAPQCRMLAPVFHPNFDDSTVCIGDFWAAAEGLDDLVIRIGRMIAYQEYNTRSPLNGLAAKWAVQNAHLLPIDNLVLAPPMAEPDAQDAITAPDAPMRQVPPPPPSMQTLPEQAQDVDPWSGKIEISF